LPQQLKGRGTLLALNKLVLDTADVLAVPVIVLVVDE
jgi:hypothetical protein